MTLAQEMSPPAPLDVGLESPLDSHIVAVRAEAFDKPRRQGEAPSSVAESLEIPPSLYARFEAFELLGQGGMGTVYRARDIRLRREVAIKLLFGADPERGGSLLREARSQARIVHENVCEVYEAGTADHVRFIVMQLIQGEPLDKAKAQMTLEEKTRVIRQVASALHEAHRLGMIHRDVKPSNIMVERGEDGAWKPYIMDFGLAREMGDTGATMTGALMGTPSFMAPEQAEGRVRSLDRRTDVYCLGATLYDVLVGRPPIVAEDLASLLHAIAHQDPTQMRKLERDLPQDLEAIVMKCLEKLPAARYDSAKALGDDLQRFLDGEPVEARKQSLGYVLWKRAKAHKGKVALASVLLVVTVVFAGVWYRAKRDAEKQALLSRELGESVKEMEFFLRNAHGMPLHDIGRERNIMRGRLKTIESWMNAAGEIGLGPGHYALGRGYLALQEPEEALTHLKQAEVTGYQPAELDYAMGMVQSELYKKELANTKRMEGEQKKKRIAAIEAEYKEPALSHLKSALRGAIEAPAYVEGLIAFYEGRHEEALTKAREAFEAAPWLYEAKKLEGDVLVAIGSKYGHDAAFDFDEMSKWFAKAEEAYHVTAELGSSDPAVYEAMCELYTQKMIGAHEAGKRIEASFEQAKSACRRAIDVNPQNGSGYVKHASMYAAFAWLVATGLREGAHAEEAIREAISHAEEAARRSPLDPMAHYAVGAVWRAAVLDARQRGSDLREAASRAARGYEAALRLDPKHLWSLAELCWVLINKGQDEQIHGRDPQPLFSQAATYCTRATTLEPSFAFPVFSLLLIRRHEADYLLEMGRSPETPVAQALEVIHAVAKEKPTWPRGRLFEARLLFTSAAYALASGGAPEKPLSDAEAAIHSLEQEDPSNNYLDEIRGLIAMMRVSVELEQGKDPRAAIQNARVSLSRAIERTPKDIDDRLWRAQVELLAFRWSMRQGNAEMGPLDEALSFLEPLREQPSTDPRLPTLFAEIHEARAFLRARHGEDVRDELERGLKHAEEALSKNPHHARALLAKGKLWLHQARTARDASPRQAAAARALASFEAAIHSNPLLERAETASIEAARKLAGERGAER